MPNTEISATFGLPHRNNPKGSLVAAQISRYMPHAAAMAAIGEFSRRLIRSSSAQQSYFRHGIPRIDNSDSYATFELMNLCNHVEPSIAAEARRVLDCFINDVRCFVRVV